jgi:hypothetical protein
MLLLVLLVLVLVLALTLTGAARIMGGCWRLVAGVGHVGELQLDWIGPCTPAVTRRERLMNLILEIALFFFLYTCTYTQLSQTPPA